MNKRIATLWKFLTYDIWRITEDEVTKTTFSLYNIIKTIYLCINRFTKDRLVNKASALTYSTLLAIVPILAIVFAIARGFGFDNLMESQIVQGFGGPSETTEVIFQFVNSYLSQTKNGIFIGVGLIMLPSIGSPSSIIFCISSFPTLITALLTLSLEQLQ